MNEETTKSFHPKFEFDEELARKLCTPDKSNIWLARQLGVSDTFISRWRRKNGLESHKSKEHMALLEQTAPEREQKKQAKAKAEAECKHRIANDVRCARELKMNYGAYKAMQFEEQKKARASLLLGKRT